MVVMVVSLVGQTGCRSVVGIETTHLIDASTDTSTATSTLTDTSTCSVPAAAMGSGVGVGWWSGCLASNGCFDAAKPTTTDRPGTQTEGADIEPIFLAFDRVQLGAVDDSGKSDSKAWKSVGFDLDGVCTNASTCSAVTSDSDRACQPLLSATPQDGDYCRDNQIGLLDYTLDALPQTSGKYMAKNSQINCALCRGGYNLIAKISGYNGSSNDPSVRVDLYPSPGLTTLKNVDCSADTWDTSACFTRTDAFTIDQASIDTTSGATGLGPATFYDPSAYVREGWLVAQLPANTPFGLVSMYPSMAPVVRIAIQSGLLVGKLENTSEGWTLSTGVIAGSTRLSTLLNEFARLGLCSASDPVTYQIVESFLKSSADMLSSGVRSPSTPCDALSLGIGLHGRAAMIGQLVTVATPSSSVCPTN
jgi:hypothetical protein